MPEDNGTLLYRVLRNRFGIINIMPTKFSFSCEVKKDINSLIQSLESILPLFSCTLPEKNYTYLADWVVN